MSTDKRQMREFARIESATSTPRLIEQCGHEGDEVDGGFEFGRVGGLGVTMVSHTTVVTLLDEEDRTFLEVWQGSEKVTLDVDTHGKKTSEAVSLAPGDALDVKVTEGTATAIFMELRAEEPTAGQAKQPLIIKVKKKGVGPEPTATSFGTFRVGAFEVKPTAATSPDGGTKVTFEILRISDGTQFTTQDDRHHQTDVQPAGSRAVIVKVRRKGVGPERTPP